MENQVFDMSRLLISKSRKNIIIVIVSITISKLHTVPWSILSLVWTADKSGNTATALISLWYRYCELLI